MVSYLSSRHARAERERLSAVPSEEEEETDDSGFYAGTADLRALASSHSFCLSAHLILMQHTPYCLTQGVQYHRLG